MFEVNQNSAQINGAQGKYDKTVTNPSVRYGRNAVDNYYSYVEKPLTEEILNTAPILDFGLSPEAAEKNEEKLNKMATAAKSIGMPDAADQIAKIILEAEC